MYLHIGKDTLIDTNGIIAILNIETLEKKENLENCIKGIFRGNEKGFGFVKIDGQDEEIYISRGNTKDAVNGDEVLIKIIDDTVEGNRKEGKIVKTINHKRNEIVGTFTYSGKYN